MNVVIDLSAYRRGHAVPGELCHIVDGGPVPVLWVRQVLGDAFVKAVLHDGVRIRRVAHFGRHIKAELRTALDLGAPPGFEGVKCSEPGCERRYGLQWDHVVPVASRGPTSYDNIQALCHVHHAAKTERDRQAGLLGQAAANFQRKWTVSFWRRSALSQHRVTLVRLGQLAHLPRPDGGRRCRLRGGPTGATTGRRRPWPG